MNSRYQFVVAGAGPAGSSMVLQLLDRGIDPADIYWYDRATFPRQKLCGGGLVSRTWDWLNHFGIFELDSAIDASGIMFVAGSHRQLMSEPGRLSAVDRYELDHVMVKRAMARGVRLHTHGIEPAQINYERDQVSLRLENQTINTRHLVGADGFSSAVRRSSSLHEGKGWCGKLFEFSCVQSVDYDYLEFDFSPRFTGIEGYLWAFPFKDRSGQCAVKYGIMDRRGAAETSQLKTILRRYAARHGVAEAQMQSIAGYPERYYQPLLPMIRGPVALIGDAYGIEPLLGEGIGIALDQSAYVADVLTRRTRNSCGNRVRSVPRYSAVRGVAYTCSRSGWNLLFLWVLGWLCYGPFWRHWIGVLTRDRALQKFSRTYSPGFGRLASTPMRLTMIALSAFLRTRRLTVTINQEPTID